ncbi:MAG TPA: LacI family transcriptional regulator [Firmicutes bacterium]|nr:LacI family transcriptional regulator [Bacillota bacterium]
MAGRVTMRDIAEKAGVSLATVSNVLGGKARHASPQTIARVYAIAEQLGYVPVQTRIPETKRSPTIGVIVYSLTSPFFNAALNGVYAVCSRLGFNIIVHSNFGREHREIVSARALVEQRVDGLIFISSSAYRYDDAFKCAVEARIPVAVVNRAIDPDAAFHVLIDNEQAAYDATQHLIALGHRAIGHIHLATKGPGATQAAAERAAGFQRALAEYGLEYREAWVKPELISNVAVSHDVIAYPNVVSMLSSAERPTAILCGTDYLAVGALRAAAALGMRVPHDLAIVGHDDTVVAQYATPTLTSVRVPMEQAGVRAAEALIHSIWKGEKLSGSEILQCELIVRDSSVVRFSEDMITPTPLGNRSDTK